MVLQYFELCGVFRKHDIQGSLPAWTAAVREEQMPEFRGNLLY